MSNLPARRPAHPEPDGAVTGRVISPLLLTADADALDEIAEMLRDPTSDNFQPRERSAASVGPVDITRGRANPAARGLV